MSKHKTRPNAREIRKAQNKADRRVAAAYLAARPVRVVEDYCVGGSDEPEHISLVEAARRLRHEGASFGEAWADAESRAPGEAARFWLWDFQSQPRLMEGAAFWREALGWLRDGGGTINVTLGGCLPSYVHFSYGPRKGDLRRVQQWVKRCRLNGTPVKVAAK